VTTFRIRDAVSGDMAALGDVFRRSSLSNDGDRPKLLAHPEVLVFSDLAVTAGRVRVAVGDEAIAGFATWALTPGNPGAVELEDLFVDPDQMRRGVGRALVRDIVAIASSRGATRVEVTANQHARAFYAKAGFVAHDYVQTTFGPAVRMHLDVT
jgi:GNAT superfamily N-acetyltransferase